MPVRKKRIETLVQELLTSNNVTEPPVRVEAIAKQFGLNVRFQRLESDLSGFLYRDDSGAVIGVNSFHANVRQRFTIAHELGHFLLHQVTAVHVDRTFPIKRNLPIEQIVGDVQGEPAFRKRNELSSQGVDVDEMEANLFAAELLMPRQFLARDLEWVGEIDITDEIEINDKSAVSELARRYNVSTQALLLRLINLGYIEQ